MALNTKLNSNTSKPNRDRAIVDHYREFAQTVRPYGISEIQVELPFFMYGLVGFAEKPL